MISTCKCKVGVRFFKIWESAQSKIFTEAVELRKQLSAIVQPLEHSRLSKVL